MYRFYNYEGGIYKSNVIEEKIEDLGGYILRKEKHSRELNLLFAVPEEDIDVIKEISDEIKGEIKKRDLIGTEIAVVSPSISRHHLPHPVCDIAERLRREGASTSIISTARGVGRRISQITREEKIMIEEYDAGVFIFGEFEDCILDYKKDILKEIKVPKIVVGGPQIKNLESADTYIGDVGRKTKRMRKTREQRKLDEITNALSECISKKREEIREDPLSVSPIEVKRIVEESGIHEKSDSHSPILLHLDGLRIKLPYDEYKQEVSEIDVYGKKLGEIAELRKSQRETDDIVVKIHTESYLEQVKETKLKVS
ncbi:MAG: Methyl coenzyme M reductase subunit C-like protein [Candidatus Methanohalarchaeum thermophilum]|uniref:Methyl coenzyme M reductase subunit C-like protein n=1 Tax=Methanohalarchaeum thermophilum TaxID=1903181 RepID=A0A1Q6DVJ2_METT1|nr:MAG: Methyl coenzyme M reductase subunit C-like protein [Candidatus Methanohalarchaeum thermophilum]